MKKLLYLAKALLCGVMALVSFGLGCYCVGQALTWQWFALVLVFTGSAVGWGFWAVDNCLDARRFPWPRLVKTTIIYGCAARGDADSPYLTRYTLLETANWQLCLHVFHRSDAPEHHDHPWDFITMPLVGGYWEETPLHQAQVPSDSLVILADRAMAWVAPFTLNRRRAEHAHRVVLHEDPNGPRRAVSLVLMKRKRRQWGFFTSRGWELWTSYFTSRGC